jgi:hypothetical protein
MSVLAFAGEDDEAILDFEAGWTLARTYLILADDHSAYLGRQTPTWDNM